VKFTPGPTNKQEFERIYNAHFEKLFYYSKKITRSDEISKDVVSDVFLNLLNRETPFSEIRELETYLFVSVKNLSIHALSLDPRRLNTQDIENSLKRVEGLNPEDILVGKELLAVVEETIKDLPDQCKLVFHFVKGKNMKYKEVAEELGITEGTVRNHLIKAMKAIRAEVEHHLDDKPSNNYYPNLGIITLLALLSLESL